jgi:very-short-patch-repair endonuclease
VDSTPPALRLFPFRGSTAIRAGLLTRQQLRGSAWRRLFPDVYVTAAVNLGHRTWCEAGLISVGADRGDRAGRVAVSGLSAAFLLGVDHLPLGVIDRIELTVPTTMRVKDSRITVVRSRLAAADFADFGRLPMTSPERTAFDLARRLPRSDAVAAIDALLHRHTTTLARIRAFVLVTGSLRGRPQVAEILSVVDPLAESPMESRLRLTIIDGGLPRPESQVEVRDAAGQLIARVDLAYRKQRIGIEYEGDHHRERQAFRRDLARVNALMAAEWRIIRASADDVRNPDKLLEQIRYQLGKSA